MKRYLILGLFCFTLSANSQNIKYNHLSINDGLSQNTVQGILQDKNGFMWFGTQDGLNRYDGYNFLVFRNDRADSNSISDNFITCLFEDSKGFIWIGTNSGGLNRYNPDNNEILRFLHDPFDSTSIGNNNIWTIVEHSSGKLFLGTGGGGLAVFNPVTNKFHNYIHVPGNMKSIPNNHVRAIVVTQQEKVFIGTESGGISEVQFKDAEIAGFKPCMTDGSKYALDLNNIVVTSFIELDPGILLVGTATDGLCKWNIDAEQLTRYRQIPGDTYSLSGNHINLIYRDQTGNVWIGTNNNGLDRYDQKTNKFIQYTHQVESRNNLGSNQITSIYQDRSGLLWVGTRDKGISRFDPNEYRFTYYKSIRDDENSLGSNTIRSIFSRDPDIIWIGTFGAGLDKLIRSDDQFIHFKPSNSIPHSISSAYISTVYEDSKGILWAGTWGNGLNKMVKPGVFVSFSHDEQDSLSLCDDRIQAIYEDHWQNLWVGTENGLSYYDQGSGNFINHSHQPQNLNTISDNRVQSGCIKQDIHGFLWVGTWNGLNRILLSDDGKRVKQVTRFFHEDNNANTLSDNRVISLLISEEVEQNNQMAVWVGTYSGGLNKLVLQYPDQVNPGEMKFTNFSTDKGLSNNIVYRIQGDDRGNLWLSTNNGLSKFNENKISGEYFRNYHSSDGLQSEQFFWGAHHKNKNGEMFFGGVNGLNVFHPDSIKLNTNVPPIVLTKFTKNNIETKLNLNIHELNQIELSYTDNSFSFEFAALDYNAPEKNRFLYFLDGFEKDWIHLTDKHEVFYTNINPGKYTFRVKGSNNDGIWNEQGTVLDIYIRPPYWATWWFRLLSLIVFITMIFAAYRYRTWRIRAHNILLQNEVRERKKTEKKLQDTRNYINKIIDSMPSILISIDATGRVTHWNEEAVKIRGIVKEHATGKMLEDVYPRLSVELPKIMTSIKSREIIKEAKIADISVNKERYSDLTVYPLENDGIAGAVIRIDDVTERVHLEEMMIQSEKMLTVGGLAAGMAHEINNPLAGMIQNAQVVINRISKNLPANIKSADEVGITMEKIKAFMEKRKILEMLNLILSSGERASQVVNNMLSFSRKTSSVFDRYQLAELIDKSVDLAYTDFDLKKKYDFRNIEIVREYTANIPAVKCEETKIEQVILNLLKNSAEFMVDQGTVGNAPARIVLRTSVDRNFALIEVEDNGIGMTEEVKNRIFEPFFTTKAVGQGTGLGLSISYFIITEHHNGIMSVESAVGKGTKFIIKIPFE